MARYLKLDHDEFGRRFLRRVGNRLSLIEKPDHECIFWDDGCSIYPARPRQCRTFPFWPSHLENPDAWNAAATECEGIGDGRLYSCREIETLSSGRGATEPGSPTDPDRQA